MQRSADPRHLSRASETILNVKLSISTHYSHRGHVFVDDWGLLGPSRRTGCSTGYIITCSEVLLKDTRASTNRSALITCIETR